MSDSTNEEKCKECFGTGNQLHCEITAENGKVEVFLVKGDCDYCNGRGYVDVKRMTREEYAEKYGSEE